MKSLGMVEVKSLTASLDAVDIMCKASNVEFVTWERKLGGKFVTVIVEGDIAAVHAAHPQKSNRYPHQKQVACLLPNARPG